jgi:hypothetical protein
MGSIKVVKPEGKKKVGGIYQDIDTSVSGTNVLQGLSNSH